MACENVCQRAISYLARAAASAVSARRHQLLNLLFRCYSEANPDPSVAMEHTDFTDVSPGTARGLVPAPNDDPVSGQRRTNNAETEAGAFGGSGSADGHRALPAAPRRARRGRARRTQAPALPSESGRLPGSRRRAPPARLRAPPRAPPPHARDAGAVPRGLAGL